MFSDIKTYELNRETSPSNFQCDLNQCRYRGSRRYRYRYGYRYRRSKNQGHDVWLPTSSKRLNHSAQSLANFNAILFWTHLLIYIQQINNTQWRHLAIVNKQFGFRLRNQARLHLIVHLYTLNAVRCPYVRTYVRNIRPERWAWPAQ